MQTEPQQQQQQQSIAGVRWMLVAMQQLPWTIISTHTLLLSILLIMLLMALVLLHQSTWLRCLLRLLLWLLTPRLLCVSRFGSS